MNKLNEMTKMELQVIELRNKIITDEQIKIDCEHTSFISHTKIDFPSIEILEKEVKQLRKELREKKIKLNKTNTLSILKERKSEYKSEVERYKQTYNTLKNNWAYYLNNNMLCVGYGNCDFYINELREYNFDIQKMFYRTSILFIVREIEIRVKEIKKELESGTNYISVSI